MLFYDMIPKAHKERKWLLAFGAVVEFIIGFAVVRLKFFYNVSYFLIG